MAKSKRMNEVAEGELEARLRIRDYDLSQEIIDQPELYYHAAREAAIAAAAQRSAEDEMKELKAMLYTKLRNEMEERGEKITEAILANAVSTHSMTKAKRKERQEASLDAARLDGLRSAYYQRSFALRDLASIRVREMESSTAVKGNGSAVDYQVEQSRAKAKELRKDYPMPEKTRNRKKITKRKTR